MGDEIHVCCDAPLAAVDLLRAAELATDENPGNAPSGTIDVARKPGVAAGPEMFGAILTGRKWRPGRTLRVRHLDGDPAIHAKVEALARQWLLYANLGFEFVAAGDAEIRISYHLDNRSWSRLGTDALAVPEPEHTMHFGWLRANTPDAELERTVVHEFGHAIGMIHEQSQPLNPIKWDRPAVYRHYAGLGWSKADVDFNVFEQYSRDMTQFSAYDDTSIMHYPVPAEFTLDHKAVGWNLKLSDQDKQFIAEIYPKPPPPGGMGAPPAAAVSAGRLTQTW